MSAPLDLAANERTALEELLERLNKEWGRSASFNDMLSRWQAFVTAVEKGYEDSIYEYTNDLSVRDRLEALLSAAPPSLRLKLESTISPYDRRFTEATDQAARSLSEAGGEVASWWHRVPVRRVGELATDLQALGYLR
jgi:hypothetical protein